MFQQVPWNNSGKPNASLDPIETTILSSEDFIFDNDPQELTISEINTFSFTSELLESLCSPPSTGSPISWQPAKSLTPANNPLFPDAIEIEALSKGCSFRANSVGGCAFSATVNTSKEPWEKYFEFTSETDSLNGLSSDAELQEPCEEEPRLAKLKGVFLKISGCRMEGRVDVLEGGGSLSSSEEMSPESEVSFLKKALIL